MTFGRPARSRPGQSVRTGNTSRMPKLQKGDRVKQKGSGLCLPFLQSVPIVGFSTSRFLYKWMVNLQGMHVFNHCEPRVLLAHLGHEARRGVGGGK